MMHSSGSGRGASDDSVSTDGTDELAGDPLELLAHVQLGRLKIDPIHGEPKNFAFAQAQDEDENKSRVQRVFIAAR